VDTLLQLIHEEPVRPRRLQPKVPRDLETVCLKCLDKEPGRRYASAAALADDLRRWREGRPTAVRPLGPIGRLGRWGRRNPAVAGLLAALAAVFLVGFGVVLWEWRTAVQQEGVARRAHGAAETRLAESLFDQGTILAERGDVERGLLTLARALEAAERAEAGDLEHVARMSLALWPRQLVRQRAAFTHQGWVPAIAFSGDSRTAISGGGAPGRHGEARLWDVVTGEPKGAPLHHEHPVWTAAFSPDDTTLVTGSGGQAGGEARLWNARTGQALGDPLPLPSRVVAAAFSRDGKALLTVSRGEARVWDLPTQRPLGPPLTQQVEIRTGAMTPDGSAVLVGLEDGTVRVHEVATGRLLATLKHKGPVSALAPSPDGRTVLTGSADGTPGCGSSPLACSGTSCGTAARSRRWASAATATASLWQPAVS
jgi:hypothetical protein